MKWTAVRIVSMLCVLTSTQSFAYTECIRTVKNVWTNLSDTETVWVTFQDEGGAVFKTEAQLSDGQMQRFFSLLLTAQSTNQKVSIRYPEDNLVCPAVGDARNDVVGIWLLSTGVE